MRRPARIALLLLGALALSAACGQAQEPLLATPPDQQESVAPPKAAIDSDLAQPIKIVLILSALTVLPGILMSVTSFTRIIVVLSFVRRALSVQEMPPNQVLIGLSLFLTIVVMQPVVGDINSKAVQPYLEGKLPLAEAAKSAAASLSGFLRSQTREEDVALLMDLTKTESPETIEEMPLHVLIPAFTLSELRTSFQMGFLVYLPFLIVDLVVASVLLSMGMFMLPPVIISTPFKILLFVLVDGWDLVIKSLFTSFQA